MLQAQAAAADTIISADTLILEPDNPLYDSLFVTDEDTVASDTTGLFKEDSLAARGDTLIPLNQKPFFSSSYFIPKEEFYFSDYKYSGDIFKLFSMAFIEGSDPFGNPFHTDLYGTGPGGTSFFRDGILMNHPVLNSFDLSLIQSEIIDSIEIVPSPRSFLYGAVNNSASVNFLTRDFISPAPYSRIKYLEGANGEAMVDGIFNGLFFNKFNLTLDITNRISDNFYTNSSYTIWQGTSRVKYFLSDKLNISLSYSYNDLNRGLNGGVDADSVLQTSNPARLFYNISAPVVFPERYELKKQHYLNLKILAEPFAKSFTDFNIYYDFKRDEITNPPDDYLIFKSKTLGTQLRQNYTEKYFNINFNGSYEAVKFDSPFDNSFNEYRMNNFSLAGIFSLTIMDSFFIPSAFYKYTGVNFSSAPFSSESFNGYGLDVVLKPFSNWIFYAGYSDYRPLYSLNNLKSFEASARFNFDESFLRLIYFTREGGSGNNIFQGNLPGVFINKASAAGIDISFLYSKILVEFSGSYYIDPSPLDLPRQRFKSGLFYKDFLFNNNLNLKTGFTFYFWGDRNLDILFPYKPVFRTDFNLYGEIKKAAIVYFIWENLFDTDYFIVPYYPMPERHIRFGISWELFN